MEDVTITKFGYDESGILTARVSRDGKTVPVTRRYGSWTTVPDDRGAFRDVLPVIARDLQAKARKLERRGVVA